MKGSFQFSPGWSATRIGWPNWVISTCWVWCTANSDDAATRTRPPSTTAAMMGRFIGRPPADGC